MALPPPPQPPPLDHPASGAADETTQTWFDHATAKRVSTDAVLARTLAAQYPDLQLVIAPVAGGVDLLAYAEAGHASFQPLSSSSAPDSPSSSSSSSFSFSFSSVPDALAWTLYTPPARRLDGGDEDRGALIQKLNYGRFAYTWEGHEFVVYVADTRDGQGSYNLRIHYILGPDRAPAERLVLAAGHWAAQLHREIWVFDQGYWRKSPELYRSVMQASWDNVILDAGLKRAIVEDHTGFFEARDTYARLQVPWKRGVIYHGPPGNGKTISIKAMMHQLYQRAEPVPTLYVRTLASYGGPEASLKNIFQRARQYAPCYLVFEDLDSLVGDRARSYFLNEVDGLQANDGIFMVGSTNHLERLDPGISKRPSRFDRKYHFPDPDAAGRTAYARFWQRKLAANPDVAFPDRLCPAVARITHGFSFAYMQEAFVAALLAIARRRGRGDDEGEKVTKKGKEEEKKKKKTGEEKVKGAELVKDAEEDGWVEVCAAEKEGGGGGGGGDDDDGLDDLVLWVELKKQVEILREGMEGSEKKGAE
ncbi:P-loop containing nucleoside triphosphate hydrolase protein [Xylariomycetidae sp. FL0641]|nr:P-loop containing nucleoside triphosphate hydrolase protein [Xylariomycetidae sp. FL0641]